jgi:class 3 adenylate cyclase
MNTLQTINQPEERELIVAFFDLTRYATFARSLSPQEGFDFMSRYYEFVGRIVERDQGIVVKFIGDAGLVAYPADRADAAVQHIKELKDQGDAWLKSEGAECRHIIKAHVGPTMCGHIGTTREKRFDVFGDTVMTAALLRSDGCAITPQLFRKLSPETRKMLKKHTPPVTYIPVDERHKD